MTAAACDTSEFSPYFRSREIHSSDLLEMQATQALRFRVYCLECGFLPAANYPQGLETDSYDACSAHFSSHDLRGELVGYVRLVRPTPQGRFPFQDHCHELLDGVQLPPVAESAEISRLMVSAQYRRRRGDLLAGVTVQEPSHAAAPERRDPSPQILLSLYRRMYTRSIDDGVRYWYAAMERPLARALRGMGFMFRQIGPQTDYHGPVAPYLADLRELEVAVEQNSPQLLRWLRDRSAATPLQA